MAAQVSYNADCAMTKAYNMKGFSCMGIANESSLEDSDYYRLAWFIQFVVYIGC